MLMNNAAHTKDPAKGLTAQIPNESSPKTAEIGRLRVVL